MTTSFELHFKLETALLILLAVKSVLAQNVLVGYYNAALQVSKLPYYFSISLAAALFPFVSYSFSNESPAILKGHIKKALRYFLAFVLTGSAFIYFFRLPIVTILFGSDFAAAAPPLATLAIAAIFLCLFYLFSVILMGIERQKLAMVLSLIVLAISWVCNLALIPIFFLNGAALATLFAFFVGSVLAGIAVWRFLPE